MSDTKKEDENDQEIFRGKNSVYSKKWQICRKKYYI